jgi:ABC-type polysaccharide/polyol phosphate export permease
MWHGDYQFVLQNLVLKDFKVRYRNMSLGAFWSLLNPLIMMSVLTLVFTKFIPNNSPHYPVKVLCGLVPFNFFTLAWANGTTSLVENAALIKRVPIPREVVPISTVLSNCLNLLIQLGVLFVFTLGSGYSVNRNWMWIPVLCGLFVIFVLGLTLASAALDVYLRDMRYVVESANLVLFWMVPIVYGFDEIPATFKEIYSLNPVSAMVMALRNILLEHTAPAASLLWKLAFASFVTLIAGWSLFRVLERRFYDHL